MQNIERTESPAWFIELLQNQDAAAAIPNANGDATASSFSQAQTSETFGFKWQKRDTFEGGPLTQVREWLIARYGDVSSAPWLEEYGRNPIMLDVGCGAAMSAIALFEPILPRLRYIGVDISAAVEVAKVRFAERSLTGAFLRADMQNIPIPVESVDIIFAEGVLHHTDNTRAALESVLRHLKHSGRILFYVYKRKSPIREFSDDYIRAKVSDLTPDQAWKALMPLTKLGKAIGDLNIEVQVPEAIDFLEIPAGKINLQRLLYWHVFKIFYREEMSLDQMNHINFDWYAPKNAHRHTIEEVQDWCDALSLSVERTRVEEAGITIIAKKK